MMCRTWIGRVALAAVVMMPWTTTIAAPRVAPISEPIHLTTPTGTIEGTLVMPAAVSAATPAKVPIVLIIAGSGPTDRNGNSTLIHGSNDAYKMLAEALAAEGIASVRYDKRGVAASTVTAITQETDLRFDMYVDDAVAWVTKLAGDARFSRVVIAGHSEGSLIGMIATARAHAAAFVSLEGPAARASDAIRTQLKPQLTSLPAVWEASDTILTSLEHGKIVDPLPPIIAGIPGIASLFRVSVQPYLISWFHYTPSVEIVKLTVPVTIVQGTTDLQIGVDQAQALKAVMPDATLVIVPEMNHLMKHASADRLANLMTYGDPTLPLAPEVPQAIIALVKRSASK